MQKQILFAALLLLALGLTFFIGAKWGARNSLSDHRNSTSVYATYDGGQILETEVVGRIKDDLKIMDRASYQLKKQTVEDIILQRTQKIDELSGNPKPPAINESDPDYQKFLQTRGLDLKKMKPLDRKNVLQNYVFSLADESRKHSRQALLNSTHIQWKIPISFFDPLVKANPGFLKALGPASTNAQIIVFANYQCPFCAEAFRKIEKFKVDHPDNLQIHFRFAFNDSENSFVFQSAKAGACANDQNKFWDYSNALIQKSPNNEADLLAAADSQKLDRKKFESCLKDKKWTSEILRDRSEAEGLKIDRPPAFIINGHLFYAQEPQENLEIVLSQFL